MLLKELIGTKLYATNAREYLEQANPELTVEEWLPTCRHASTMLELLLLAKPYNTLSAVSLLLTAIKEIDADAADSVTHIGTAYHLVLASLLEGVTAEEGRCALVEAVEHIVVDAVDDLDSSEQLVQMDDRQVILCRLFLQTLI